MRTRRLFLAALASAGLFVTAGCGGDFSFGSPPDAGRCWGPFPHTLTNPMKKVDVLFVVDDSLRMAPEQSALASQFKSFVAVLDKSGADYHIGIVTSDCGAQPPPAYGSLSGPLGGKCDSVIGDNGALQAVPCSSRPATDFSSAGVQSLCKSLCPTPIAPTNAMVGGDVATSNFIASTGGMSPVTNVPGKDVAGAFACMAFVGNTGCDLEMPLEGMKRALDGTNPVQNNFFPRKDALLAVILLTDEDDCSTVGKNRLEDDPMTMDCSPGGSASPSWACFNPDYRCYAMGTECAQPLDQTGVKTSCQERPGGGGMVEDMSYYTNFLDKLKPHAVVVDAIDSPHDGPVEIDQDAPVTPALNRSLTNPACEGPIDPLSDQPIAGLPETRLHDFVQHFHGREYSVCDVADYPKMLQDVANHIVDNLVRNNCLPPLGDFGDGGVNATPSDQCTVLQTSPATGCSTTVGECSPTCCGALATDPNGLMSDPTVLYACEGEKVQPCWCAVRNPTACPSALAPTLIGVYGGSTGTYSFACQEMP